MPVLVLGAWLAWQQVQGTVHEQEAKAQATAEAAATAIDRSLRSRMRGLSMLAEMPKVDDPARWPELYALAQGFQKSFGGHVVLADLQMQIRLNTRVPYGTPPTPLPQPQGRAAVPLALGSGKPAVGDSFIGPQSGERLIAIAVPVLRDGRAIAVLLSTLNGREMQSFLDEQPLPPAWSIAVRDGTGVLIAGRGLPSGHGQPASNAVGAAAADRYRFSARSTLAPWSVTVEIQVTEHEEPAVAAALAVAAGGLLATAAGIVSSFFASRRLVRSLDDLTSAQPGSSTGSSAAIAEMAVLRRRLDDAAALRTKAKTELEQREHDYRTLFDQHPQPMWIVEPATLRIEAVNAIAVRRYGWTAEEFRALSVYDLVAFEERARLQALSAGVAVDDYAASRVRGEWTTRTRAGQSIVVEMSWNDLEFDGRRRRLVLAVDVTGRHEVERQRMAALNDALRSRNLLRETLDRVSDGFVALDRDERFAFVNRRAAQVMQCQDAEQLLGRRLTEQYPVPPDHPVRRAIERARRSGQAEAVEHLGDLSGRWFETRVYPSADGLTMYFSDIDDRRRAEQTLKDSEARYRLMFDRNPNPMWVFDRPTLRFLAVNEAAMERYGYRRDEFMALTIAQIRPPEEVPAMLAALGDPARAARRVESVGRFVHQTKAGECLDVEVSVSDLDFAGYDATLVLVRDLSASVRAEHERDQAAALLAEREERLRLFFEHAPAALAMFDREMRYVAASQRWRVDFDLGEQDLIGRSHYDAFPEIGDELKALHQRGLQGEVMRADEDRFVRADGRVHWLRWEMLPWRAAGGAIGGIVIFSEDVTERMQALEALRASERDFRALAEQMPGIVYRARLDPPGHTEYVSPQIAELGFTPAQWIGQPELLWDAIHPDDRQRVRAETEAAYAGLCDEVHLEYRFRDAQGNWRYCSDHARVIRPPHEAPFVLGVNVDVTHVRAAEAALRRSEERFRTLAEQMPAIIYVAPADSSAPALYVSPAIASLGYSPQQWTSTAGPNWQQVMHPDDRERVLRQLGRNLVAGEVLRLEFRLRASQGGWHDFVEYGCCVEGEHGEPLMQGVMIDVSDFKRTQRELLASRSELSALAQRLLTQERETAHHLAQTLHDHLGQSLAVARLHLDATMVRLGAALPRELKDDCTRVTRTLDQAIADVRMVLGELRPPLLEDQGLVAALDTELHPRRSGRDEVDVLLEVDAPTMTVRWPANVEYGAFMIAREAVVNALLHADATLVRVIVEGDGHWLTLKVVDDGRGIADDMRQGRPGHLGLVGMRERALAIGARLDVERVAEGGTCVALHWREEKAA